MRFLLTAAVCLTVTSGFAQSPQPRLPPAPADLLDQQPPSRPLPMQEVAITQKSRVRAFDAGPEGQVQSIYLANGSVVNLSPNFGPGLSSQIHKRARISVTGSRSMVNGQTIINPQQVMIGQQSFNAQPFPGPDRQADLAPRPPHGEAGAAPPPAGDRGVRRVPGGEREQIHVPPPPAGGPGMPPPPPGPGAPPVPPPLAGPGAPPPPPPPAGLKGPGRPPRPAGRDPEALTPNPVDSRRNAPPPTPNGGIPLPAGSSTAPAPSDSTQPAPSALPNL